jgi:hypothetical protein
VINASLYLFMYPKRIMFTLESFEGSFNASRDWVKLICDAFTLNKSDMCHSVLNKTSCILYQVFKF